MTSANLDEEIRRMGLRPPCPGCQRRTMPLLGLDEQLIFRCWGCGDWTLDQREDAQGDPLPVFRWQIYDWRFA